MPNFTVAGSVSPKDDAKPRSGQDKLIQDFPSFYSPTCLVKITCYSGVHTGHGKPGKS